MSFEDWKAGFLNRTSFPSDLANHLERLEAPVAADANQAEARKTLQQYLARAVSDTRVKNGQAQVSRNLSAITDAYPVDPATILAIWGLETNYGAVKGDIPVFAALASLAANGRRRALFEDQLCAAADMVKDRAISPDRMIGSWAGAMGHTQFMPRSYMTLARSLDGNTPDIWGDDPTDALTSTAHYLHHHGARKNMPWGARVDLPDDFDIQSARTASWDDIGVWRRLGIKSALSSGVYRFLLPAGHLGPAFLVSASYDAVLAYNHADAYALAVCHLADRIAKRADAFAPWADDGHGLSQAEMQEIQTRLTQRGFDTIGADGFTGPNTIRAIEAFQAEHSRPVDGHADLGLLNVLRSET